MSDPTPAELQRRLDQIQRELDRKVETGEYRERKTYVNKELADHQEWHDKHEDGHTWLWRLVAATALTVLVTLITVLIQNIGVSP